MPSTAPTLEEDAGREGAGRSRVPPPARSAGNATGEGRQRQATAAGATRRRCTLLRRRLGFRLVDAAWAGCAPYRFYVLTVRLPTMTSLDSWRGGGVSRNFAPTSCRRHLLRQPRSRLVRPVGASLSGGGHHIVLLLCLPQAPRPTHPAPLDARCPSVPSSSCSYSTAVRTTCAKSKSKEESYRKTHRIPPPSHRQSYRWAAASRPRSSLAPWTGTRSRWYTGGGGCPR